MQTEEKFDEPTQPIRELTEEELAWAALARQRAKTRDLRGNETP